MVYDSGVSCEVFYLRHSVLSRWKNILIFLKYSNSDLLTFVSRNTSNSLNSSEVKKKGWALCGNSSSATASNREELGVRVVCMYVTVYHQKNIVIGGNIAPVKSMWSMTLHFGVA